MNKRTPLVAILTMGIFSFLFGQDLSAFEKRTFVDAQGDTLRYRILYPAKYKRDRQYPFVLFLHGAGERGQDNEKQLTHGARMWTDKANRKKFPAIVVFPQCETDDYWAHMTVNEVEGVRYRDFPIQQEPKPSLSRVMQLVDELLQTESIDPARQYVMGLSMGAMGTFELLSRMPDRFAAAVATPLLRFVMLHIRAYGFFMATRMMLCCLNILGGCTRLCKVRAGACDTPNILA
ncbi:MAG TPA: alpha/beta hydrolase-fold protein [Saprospiraceae bacterium]|nr:alpha/beta hydrolase-fold protein [Saprospiraceae bacterium]